MSEFIIKRADGKNREVKGYICQEAPASAPMFKASLKSSSLPKKVDLRSYMTEVEDQGQVGSCTANAVAGAYEYLVKKNQELDYDYDVSRLFIYYGARAMRGNQKKDSGSMIGDSINLLAETGVCSEETWPYSEDMKVVFTQPDDEAFEEASEHKITDAEVIPVKLEAWKSALAEGYPIIFGISLFKSFDQQRKKGYVPTPSKSESSRGSHASHAMLCVGYSDVDKVFIVRNSWGKRWGDKGYCYISYDYMMNKNYNLGDSWIIRDAEPVENYEENWSDDDESILTELNDEFANMSDEDWESMNEEMGDLSFAHRLGLLFYTSACMDDKINKKERAKAIEHLNEVLDMFGYEDLDAEGVFDNAAESLDIEEEALQNTVDIFAKYLSYGALSTILEQMKEVAGADGMDDEEAEFIDNVESIWLSEGDDEDDDEDDDEEDDEEGDEEEGDEEYDEDEDEEGDEEDDEEGDDEEYDEDEEGDDEEYDEDEEGDEEEGDEEYDEDEDEDEEGEIDLEDYNCFEAVLGGEDSDAPSYISICGEDVFDVEADEEDLANVEIVFTGKNFISADECKNGIVSENGNAANIEVQEKGSFYAYATNTGFEGYIEVVEGDMRSKSSEVKVNIYYIESEEE